jgi:hypothetical protein
VAEGGAGAFQMLSHQKGSLSTWGDDPFDNYMIKFGYSLDEEPNSEAGQMTSDDFTDMFEKYIQKYGAPPDPLGAGY